MTPHWLDITRVTQAGTNRLVLDVTDELVNYVSGLQEPPEMPTDLQPRLGQANPKIYRQSGLAKRDMSETDLPPSGLLGPVRIIWQPK